MYRVEATMDRQALADMYGMGAATAAPMPLQPSKASASSLIFLLADLIAYRQSAFGQSLLVGDRPDPPQSSLVIYTTKELRGGNESVIRSTIHPHRLSPSCWCKTEGAIELNGLPVRYQHLLVKS